jgi:chaperonin GroES
MSKVPLAPLADYVVACQEAAQTKTASGLFLPDNTGEKPKIATVVAVGPAAKDVQVDDKIIFGGYSNTDIKIDGVEYMLIKQENIFAKVN